MSVGSLRMSCVEFDVKDGNNTRVIFEAEDFYIPKSSLVGICGTSGSGKSTFLKLISGILVPTVGDIVWGDYCISSKTAAERDRWRGRHIGFLFQDFRLFDGLTAEQNAVLPFTFRHKLTQLTVDRARAMLLQYGLFPDTPIELLSRGEMQRVALVRVLLQNPSVILADEPTASLDPENAERVGDALIEAARYISATLIVVTHDQHLLHKLPLQYELKGGHLSLLREEQE